MVKYDTVNNCTTFTHSGQHNHEKPLPIKANLKRNADETAESLPSMEQDNDQYDSGKKICQN